MEKFPCIKCSGTGLIAAFSGIQGGVCFACEGRGFVIQKNAPRLSKLYVIEFLWDDPADVNYRGGEFCNCGRIKARSKAEAERKAAKRMANNGSVAFRLEEAA